MSSPPVIILAAIMCSTEATAIEVERIAESNRFVARLLGESRDAAGP